MTNSQAIDINALPEYQQEAMCRTIITGIHNLFQDERNREDFEQWKKNKKRRI
jgi:hypothetical protein